MKYEIEQDTDPGNPRKEWDNFGHMVCWHRHYILGDEMPKADPTDWIRSFAGDLVNAQDPELIPDNHIKRILEKHCVILPLHAYEHGGITISCSTFSDPFDSGQIGWIYATMEEVDKEFKGDRDKAISLLKCEVKEYDRYLTGDVWCVSIIDDEGETVDSCCGFYGYEYAEAEAKEMLRNAEAEAEAKANTEVVYAL